MNWSNNNSGADKFTVSDKCSLATLHQATAVFHSLKPLPSKHSNYTMNNDLIDLTLAQLPFPVRS